MSVQLLDKTRKINKLLHNNSSSKIVFNDICDVLKDILASNIHCDKRNMILCQGIMRIIWFCSIHIPIITMNIDGLHRLAGSDALELHGGLPEDDEMDIAYSLYNKPVLYGDPAPNYQLAYEMVYTLQPGDVFLVVGCSFHTGISVDLRELAKSRGARIIEIQEDAAHNVRKILEELLNNN